MWWLRPRRFKSCLHRFFFGVFFFCSWFAGWCFFAGWCLLVWGSRASILALVAFFWGFKLIHNLLCSKLLLDALPLAAHFLALFHFQ